MGPPCEFQVCDRDSGPEECYPGSEEPCVSRMGTDNMYWANASIFEYFLSISWAPETVSGRPNPEDSRRQPAPEDAALRVQLVRRRRRERLRHGRHGQSAAGLYMTPVIVHTEDTGQFESGANVHS